MVRKKKKNRNKRAKKRKSSAHHRSKRRIKAVNIPTIFTSNKSRSQYVLNSDFEFFPELKSLILKASSSEKNHLIRQISKLGRIKLAVIAGIFLDSPKSNVETNNAMADLLIVGEEISKKRLNTFLKQLEAEVGAEVRFGVMDIEEFEYRYSMFDRFIRVLLEGPHEKIINRIGI